MTLDKLVIAGDVSATNILAGIYSINGDDITPIFEEDYKGQEITDFNSDVVDDMIKRSQLTKDKITSAVFSPAGPIINGKCNMTNAPFSLDAFSMGMPSALINDFKAIAYAVATSGVFGTLHCTLLNTNSNPEENARIGIHGAGTGFGAARLDYNKEKGMYFPLDSEGGHKFLSIDPSDKTEVAIARWLMRYTGGRKPNYEDVLTGRGIERVFEFFANESIIDGRGKETADYLLAFKSASDKAAYVGQKSAQDSGVHPIFERTMDFFWKVYGRALHDMAVHENARGGVWVAGGIIRKDYGGGTDAYKNHVKSLLMEEFNSGETHRGWVGKIPVYAILDKRVGLQGCIQVAANENYMRRELAYK